MACLAPELPDPRTILKCQAKYKEKNKEKKKSGKFFFKTYIQTQKRKKKLEQEDSNKVTLDPKHGAPTGSRDSKIHKFKGTLSSKDMTGE